jgi:hypothetical protein
MQAIPHISGTNFFILVIFKRTSNVLMLTPY